MYKKNPTDSLRFWEPVRLFFYIYQGSYQPSSLNPKLSTLNSQPSTINPLSHHRLDRSFLSATVHVEEEDTRLELETF